MNALVVSANLQGDTLLTNGKILILNKLQQLGYSIEESDLDAQQFNPYITIEEYNVEEKENLYTAQCQAYPNNYSPDVQSEMAKLKRADLIIVIAKLTNTLAPTILLGWLQRVFPIKFAVFSEDKNLDGKKFLFITGQESEHHFDYIQKFIGHNFGGLNLDMLDSLFYSTTEELSKSLEVFNNLENWPKMRIAFNTDLTVRTLVS